FGGARQLLFGIGERRLGGGKLRLALVDGGFERFLLDRKDDLAFFDLVAVLEQAGPRKPCTRARRSTFSSASARPTNSACLVIDRSSAGWTNTAGGGRPCWGFGG